MSNQTEKKITRRTLYESMKPHFYSFLSESNIVQTSNEDCIIVVPDSFNLSWTSYPGFVSDVMKAIRKADPTIMNVYFTKNTFYLSLDEVGEVVSLRNKENVA